MPYSRNFMIKMITFLLTDVNKQGDFVDNLACFIRKRPPKVRIWSDF